MTDPYDMSDIVENPIKEPSSKRGTTFISIGVIVVVLLIIIFVAFDHMGRNEERSCFYSSQCEKGLRCEDNMCINIDDPSVITFNPKEEGKAQIGNYTKSTINTCATSVAIGKDDTQIFTIGCAGKAWKLDPTSKKLEEQTQLGDNYIFISIEKFAKDNVNDLFLGFIDSSKKGSLRKGDGTNVINITTDVSKINKVISKSNGNGESFVIGSMDKTVKENEIFEMKADGTVNSQITEGIDETDICVGTKNTLYSLDFFRTLHIAVDITSSPTRWNKVAPGFLPSNISCASENMILFKQFGLDDLFIAQDKVLKLFSNKIEGLKTFDIAIDGSIVLGFNNRVELYKPPTLTT